MSNSIHPSALIGPHVSLGSRNTIGPGVVISGRVVLGDDNWIGPYAVIGSPPEIRDADLPELLIEASSDAFGVVIGSRNVIREFSTIHAGSIRNTYLADDILLLRGSHVGHDALVGPKVTISCSALIGGHCILFPQANIGLGAQIHQKLRIGAGAMIGMGTSVRSDVESFSKLLGNPAKVIGINKHLLSAMGLESKDMIDFIDAFPGESRFPIAAMVRQWEEFLSQTETA